MAATLTLEEIQFGFEQRVIASRFVGLSQC
jgi:hypothetical protein